MKLWIRSQDKTNLILAKDIVVSGGDIKVYKDTELCTTVAMYKTKERAIEVLDEIQNILKPQMIISKVGKPIAQTCDDTVYREPDEYDIKEISTYVYEMPIN